jgi:hypothetical protein
VADEKTLAPAASLAFGIVTMHKEIDTAKGRRLMVAFQLQGPGGVPLSHMMEVPGEVLPVIIASLQALIEQYPQFTKDLCELGETREITAEEMQATKPSGLVDTGGKPLKIVKH